jgi:hypothetical protein
MIPYRAMSAGPARPGSRAVSRIAGWAAVAMLAAWPSAAMIQCSTGACCVNDVNGSRGANCTSNDVTFVLVGLGLQSDGCVNTNDSVSIKLRAVVQNTTAQARYDVGMYIATDGDPNGDGAVTGQCARERLAPASPTSFVDDGVAPTCVGSDGTLLDLLREFSGPNAAPDDNGYFLTAETGGSNSALDACGDLYDGGKGGCDSDGDGLWDDSVMDFTSPVTVPCDDTDSDGMNPDTSGDGFVNLPTCATWGNQANEVYTPTSGAAPNDTCDSEAELVNGTAAKCRCEDSNSDIPVARLALSCSCTPGSVRPGQSTACTVTYSNGIDCTPDPATPERFRCGTASYVRFKTDYLETIGTVFSTTAPQPVVSGNGSVDSAITPVPAVDDPIVWRPRNQISGGSLGIVGDDQSGTLTFQYLVDPGTANGTYTIASTDGYWSDVASFSPEVQQAALAADCSITVSDTATWVAVTQLRARERDGRVVVEWETAAEVGTLGFVLERWDPAARAFVAVRDGMVPAVQQTPGGRYHLVDPGAPTQGVVTYRVVEVDTQGRRHAWGPFRTTVAPAAGPRPALRAGFAARGKDPSERVVASTARRELRAWAAPASSGGGPAAAAKIEVAETGLVWLRAAQIAAGLGEPLAKVGNELRAGRYRVTHGGGDVAWEAAPGGDGLVFYGESIDSPFASRNVYWLERGAGVRMASQAGVPAAASAAGASFAERLHVETDSFPGVFAAVTPRDDYWFWRSLVAGFPGVATAELDLDVPAPAAGAATLAVNLHIFGAARLEASLGGVRLGEASLSGLGAATASFSVPAGALRDGANRVELAALEGIFYLDSLDVAYPRLYRARAGELAFRGDGNDPVVLGGFASAAVELYDLGEPRAPRRVTGVAVAPAGDGTWGLGFRPASAERPYLAVAADGRRRPAAVRPDAASDLRSSRNGAAYLVITSAELRAPAERLAAHRAGAGLSTMVVDLEDVFDEFSDGVPDPDALRGFLMHAANTWQEPPRYVALTGKGSYDYRDLWGLGLPGVPASMVATPAGLVAADGGFADFDEDGLPELAVGRIPAVDAEELAAYVDKLIAYEGAAPGDWASRATLVADNADQGGDFPATSEIVAAPLVLAGRRLDRIYLPAPAGEADVAAGRAALLAALREGRGLVNYVGHGGLDRLASEGLLTIPDLGALDNGARLPVFTALTCNIGLFAYPGFSSIGEELVLLPGGGAVALFAPSGLSFNGEAAQLGARLLERLAGGTGLLGDRTLAGLRAHAAAGGDRGAVRSYNLLGDPGLRLK